jgi:hypothetical protein
VRFNDVLLLTRSVVDAEVINPPDVDDFNVVCTRVNISLVIVVILVVKMGGYVDEISKITR